LLLGAAAVGGSATRLADERAAERLSSAGAVVNSAVNAVCQRALAAAEALATAIARGDEPGPASRLVVSRGLAEAAQVQDARGRLLGSAGSLTAATSWGDCAQGRAPTSGEAVLAASVDVLRADGRQVEVRAALLITAEDLKNLAGLAGVGASALVAGVPMASVLPAGALAGTAKVVEVGDARYRLRRLPPVPGRPIETVLSVRAPDPTGLYGALAVIVVVAATAALLASNSLANTLTRPLREVAAAAELVAGGDLATRLPVRAHDEIGQLASTFNRMTRGMESYVAALTAGRDQLRRTLVLLGDTMSSTNDVDRILDVILESLVATTAAEAGIVLLVDPGGALVGRRGLGLLARGVRPEAVRVLPGDGLLGGVAASGEARCGRVAGQLTLEPDCRTYLVAPIVGPPHPPAAPAGRLLGVLALYDRLGGDEFDDADVVTVRSFAGHAAVAVENALLHREVTPAIGRIEVRETSALVTDRSPRP
jgi:HAMP domain-containing protein